MSESKCFNLSERQCHGNNYDNYTAYGFGTPCGCGNGYGEDGTDQSFIDALDNVREALGIPLITSCIYRCPVHNERVGGVPNSAHRQGKGADIQTPPGYTPTSLRDAISQIVETLYPGESFGLGRYSWGVHFSRGAGEGWFEGGY